MTATPRRYPHTPGPWTAHSGSVYVDGPDVFPKGTQENGVRIVSMYRAPGGVSPTECDSNAILIAAAPDLLAALESVLEFTNQEPCVVCLILDTGTVCRSCLALNAARAAIDTATGGQGATDQEGGG